VHTPETIPGKAATCTEEGLTDGSKCATCGEILEEQTVIPALGHDWDEGKVIKEPTTLAAGSKEYTCKRCGATKEEEIPKILLPLGQSGWVGNSDGTWSYGDDSGNAVIGPMIDRGNLYVFSEKGKMITGWEKVGDHWYCAQATGEAYHDLWKEIKGNWYHFNSAGEMAAGWQLINGSWLYFGDNGALRTGWQKIKGNWYLFASHGELVIGWYKDKDGSWYYLDTDGKMLTGWQMIDGSWYYFGNTGAMATGWKQLNGKWFYLASYGQMVTGWYKDKGGIFYWFDENGIMATGWKQIGGQWEMFDSAGKWLYTWDGK
jgi:glucan-binding YG repeat protein